MTGTGKAGFTGFKPAAKIEPIKKQNDNVVDVPLTGEQVKKLTGLTDEKLKYVKMYNDPDYRKFSPGEELVPYFLELAGDVREDDTIIDFGSGTGRAALSIREKTGANVVAIDFAGNAMDEHVKDKLDGESFQYMEHDLNNLLSIDPAEWGFCTDVMEHVPPHEVNAVLMTILSGAHKTFFQIATEDDAFGARIGEPLHLTVKPYDWWARKFLDFGCVIKYSMELPHSVIFFVESYAEFPFWRLGINTDLDVTLEHIRAAHATGLPGIVPCEPQEDREIMLVCGGPTMRDFADEIKEQREAGMGLITVNGAYNYCIEELGLKPSMQFMIDAREFNTRFLDPVIPECKYVIATQCHPSVWEKLPTEPNKAGEPRAFVWHVSLEDEQIELTNELWGPMNEAWAPCPGGSTVTLRALNALQMLGFRKIHVYGFDSCMVGDEHHAYPQDENEHRNLSQVRIGRGTKYDRTFQCQPWMAAQAKEFVTLTRVYYQDLKLNVKGDGLIAHMIKTGAASAPLEE